MDNVDFVPASPPAPLPEVASFLVEAGWPVEAGPVRPVAIWLHENGVKCKLDFVGLEDIQLLPRAAELHEEAAAFLQQLVTSADCRMVTWSAPTVNVDRAKRCAVHGKVFQLFVACVLIGATWLTCLVCPGSAWI